MNILQIVLGLLLSLTLGVAIAQTGSRSSNLDWAKKKCGDLGFKERTEKFGNCVLQLSRDDVRTGVAPPPLNAPPLQEASSGPSSLPAPIMSAPAATTQHVGQPPAPITITPPASTSNTTRPNLTTHETPQSRWYLR